MEEQLYILKLLTKKEKVKEEFLVWYDSTYPNIDKRDFAKLSPIFQLGVFIQFIGNYNIGMIASSEGYALYYLVPGKVRPDIYKKFVGQVEPLDIGKYLINSSGIYYIDKFKFPEPLGYPILSYLKAVNAALTYINDIELSEPF